METKKILRAQFKQMRIDLGETAREQAAVAVANQLKTILQPNWQRLHVYLPISRLYELDTEPLIALLWGLNREIVVSVADFETSQMKHFLLDEETRLLPNAWGIPEPVNGKAIEVASIDAVIIPLLAADQHGYRLGYGKGFYDRFLATCPHAKRIGIGYFNLIEKVPEVHEFDQKLHYYIHPNGIHNWT